MDSETSTTEKNGSSSSNNESEKLERENSEKEKQQCENSEEKQKEVVKDVKKPVRKKLRRRGDLNRREPTPIRDVANASDKEERMSSDISEISNEHVQKNGKISNNNTLKVENGDTKRENVERRSSFKDAKKDFLEILDKTENLSRAAQDEVKTFLKKSKKSLISAAHKGRERFRKYEKQWVKRSQSAPNNFDDGQETLQMPGRKLDSKRKYSDLGPDDYEEIDFVARNRSFTRYGNTPTRSTKIIEVLKPKTPEFLKKSHRNIQNYKIKAVRPLFASSISDITRNYKRHVEEFKKEHDSIKKLVSICLVDIFLVMLFCGMGALIFKFTEGSFETLYKCGVKRVKRDFVDMLWTKSHNLREEDWKSLAIGRLRRFEEEIHNAHEAGMTDYSGQRAWTFLNGIVYSLTVITSIGYGHMFPKTTTGRALTIVYALIGIPLFLIALTDFGKLFTRGIKFVWSFVRRLYYTGTCRKVRRESIFNTVYDIATFRRPSENPDNPPSQENASIESPTTPAISNFEIDDEFNLPISVALFILVAYIFCGACIYMVIEEWGFFEAFYFVFISMSTIGFGDYVPRHPVFMIGSIIYLVFGLALMSMCINVVQAKLSDTFKQASAKIGATIGLDVDEEGSVLTVPPENVEVTPVHTEKSPMS